MLAFGLTRRSDSIVSRTISPVHYVDPPFQKEPTKSYVRHPYRMKYVIVFANIHRNFWIAELEALVDIFSPTSVKIDSESLSADSVLVTVECSNEGVLRKIVERSILIQYCIRPWISATSLDDVIAEAWKLPRDYVDEFNGCSWQANLESFNAHRILAKKKARLEAVLAALPIQAFGPVKLKGKADVTLKLLEEYDRMPIVHGSGGGATLREKKLKDELPDLRHVILGREIAVSNRKMVRKFLLSDRKYLSTTSCDAELSFVISNIAQTQRDFLVIDPFMGSASMLVAAAQHGACVFGSDIDGKLFSPKEGQTQLSNFEQYDLSAYCLDFFNSDVYSLPFRILPNGLFDGIVCDPPYGMRASARKLKNSEGNDNSTAERTGLSKDVSSAKSQIVSVPSIVMALMSMAATSLRLGRRVAFWFPVIREKYDVTELPKHPALEMVANCEQPITRTWSRRLLVFKKVRIDNGAASCTASSDFARIVLKDEKRVVRTAPTIVHK